MKDLGGEITHRYRFGIAVVSPWCRHAKNFPLTFTSNKGHAVEEPIILRKDAFPFEREHGPEVETLPHRQAPLGTVRSDHSESAAALG